MVNEFLHVVCPDCNAINRIPQKRMRESPKCGQCHALLFNGEPVTLTDANFDKQIGRNDIPVVVDFWAPWCGPCRAMAPAFAQAAQQLEPEVRFAKLNTEASQLTASRYAIRSIPTMVLFKHGREIVRQAGAMGATDIVRWVRAQV